MVYIIGYRFVCFLSNKAKGSEKSENQSQFHQL